MQQQSDGIYNRKFPRRAFVAPMGVLYHGLYFTWNIVEVGEGGMRFESPRQLEPGELIVGNFYISPGNFVTVISEIKYEAKDPEGKFFYGVQFLNVSFDQRRRIRDFIAAKH